MKELKYINIKMIRKYTDEFLKCYSYYTGIEYELLKSLYDEYEELFILFLSIFSNKEVNFLSVDTVNFMLNVIDLLKNGGEILEYKEKYGEKLPNSFVNLYYNEIKSILGENNCEQREIG